MYHVGAWYVFSLEYTKMDDSYLSTEITVNVIVQSIAYVVGLFVNLKVISVCLRNRDTKTWQIHIAQSIINTIFFGFDIPFVTISNALPHLSRYTGEWFCYMASFIVNYEVYFLVTNSFLIAVMKYIYIVHWDKAMGFGHERIQRIFLIIAIAFPCFNATVVTLTKDFDSYKAIKSCFGMPRKNMSSRIGVWEKLFLCNLSHTGTSNADVSHVLYMFIQIICVSRSLLSYFFSTNLPEAFFYYKIFKQMRR